MQHFKFIQNNLFAFTKIRNGETKIGEKIQLIEETSQWEKEIRKSKARFVVFGICESIGVQANFGIGGTETAFHSFLQAFCNVQQNQFLQGESILLLGNFDFSPILKKTKDASVEYLRDLVNVIDEEVSFLVEAIVAHNKVPLIIGGGHNNAYGNIKGSAKGMHRQGKMEQINVLNFDAHADFRPLEGRHSGNGFHYAMHDNFLHQYAMLGLHENYMTQEMWGRIKKNDSILPIFFEDIAIRKKYAGKKAIELVLQFLDKTPCGVEIDLDCIENVLCSAMTPSGFSVTEIRKYLYQFQSKIKPVYLHICEGAEVLSSGKTQPTIGKLITYLVTDFIKNYNG